MVAAYVSERINGFGIALPLPNHKGNFNRKTLLYVGRKHPLPSQHPLNQFTTKSFVSGASTAHFMSAHIRRSTVFSIICIVFMYSI